MHGPALPADTIEGFRKIIIEDVGTSNMVMDQLCKFVRAENFYISVHISRCRQRKLQLLSPARMLDSL